MSYTQLSLDQAPDIWSPLRFFMSAPLFAMAAAILLFFSGPDILQSRWLPQTLAITHLITLGFITMVMIGASFQLLPVLAGSGIYASKITSKFIHRLMLVGISLFCAGLYISDAYWIKLSLFVFIPAIFVFLTLASIALFKASFSFASANGMRLSVGALWIVLILGVLLAAGTAWDGVPLLRELTDLHVIWAALGWVVTMLVAISLQVIPMFQVTSEYSKAFKKWFFIILFFCLFMLSIQTYFNVSSNAMFFIISVELLVFSIISIKLLLQRKKRLADASLYYWLTGLTSLLISVFIFNVELLLNINLNILLGFVFFIGFVTSIINGMLFKIVPFLIWLHLNKKLAFSEKGLSSVPTMNEVIGRKKMLFQYLFHMISLVLTLLSFYLPSVFFNVAMIFWLASFSVLFLYLLQAVRLYYACIQDI